MYLEPNAGRILNERVRQISQYVSEILCRLGFLVIGLGLITMEIDIRVTIESPLIMQAPGNFS